MRAVVRRNKQLVCDEIAELEPAAGQVLVRTLACGICGSDLHALHHMEHMIELGRRGGGGDNGFDPSADTVFGHEFCAEILDHGPGSPKALKAGTRVVSVPELTPREASRSGAASAQRSSVPQGARSLNRWPTRTPVRPALRQRL